MSIYKTRTTTITVHVSDDESIEFSVKGRAVPIDAALEFIEACKTDRAAYAASIALLTEYADGEEWRQLTAPDVFALANRMVNPPPKSSPK